MYSSPLELLGDNELYEGNTAPLKDNEKTMIPIVSGSPSKENQFRLLRSLN
jgi:hypothetical protein